MTKEEYNNITNTDRAFFRLEGRCRDCGCDLNGVFRVHSEWCQESPAFIWYPPKECKTKVTIHSRRHGKSVFANMVKEFNKLFGKQK